MKTLRSKELYNLYRGMSRQFGKRFEDSYAIRKAISAYLKTTTVPVNFDLLFWASSAPWADNSPGRMPVQQSLTAWYKVHKAVPYHLREIVKAKIAARIAA